MEQDRASDIYYKNHADGNTACTFFTRSTACTKQAEVSDWVVFLIGTV